MIFQSFYNRLNDVIIQNIGMRDSMQFQVYVMILIEILSSHDGIEIQ